MSLERYYHTEEGYAARKCSNLRLLLGRDTSGVSHCTHAPVHCCTVFVVLCSLLFVLFFSSVPCAGEADVLDVKIQRTGAGIFTFTVTVRHDDEGWDHYASQWEVLGPGDVVMGTRVLYHPPVGEQPFTRSLPGVQIPEGVSEVTIRARDSVHGFGGKELQVQLKE